MGETLQISRGLIDDFSTSKPEDHELRKIETYIHPGGADATITFHANDGRMRLSASIEVVASAAMHLRHAEAVMRYRTSMAGDDEKAIERLLSTALRPLDVSVLIDPATGDRIFVLNFDGHPPIMIRMEPEHVAAVLADLGEIAKKTSN